jgi:lysozyme family protein
MNPELKKEYDTLWKGCSVDERNLPYVTWATNQCISNKNRYEEIANKAMCPWYLVGALHCIESNFNFTTHLYNGDPLTDRTVSYPEGRPQEGFPPFTWEHSAFSALREFGSGNIIVWDIAHVLYFCEKFDRYDYRDGYGRETTPPYRSPYLWAMTNNYHKGRFTESGDFDPNGVESTVGVAAILKMIESRGMIPTEEEVSTSSFFEPSKKPNPQNQIMQLHYHLSLAIKNGELAKWIKQNYESLPTAARNELKQCENLIKVIPSV